jgi:hypothetical protein
MTKAEIEDRKEAFVKELTNLSRKHGIYIGGCGCCGSPSLDAIPETLLGGSYDIKNDGGAELEWSIPQ